MSRYLFTILALGLCLTGVEAQQLVRYFELATPKHKVPGSLYRHIEFMDSRPDTLQIGPIQIGPLSNIDATLRLKRPVQPQLQRVLDSLVDASAQDGTLLFQLRDISFVEPNKARYLFVKATLYARTNDRLRKLCTFDSTFIFDGNDVADQMDDEVNPKLDQFIAGALTRRPTDTVTYTLTDLARIDSIEEARIPLYTAATLTDGIYFNYASFSQQRPDCQGIIKTRSDGSVRSVHILGSAAERIRLRSRDLYAIVSKGRPFIATVFGFYPLERVRDNLFFTGDIRIEAGAGDIVTSALIVSPIVAAEVAGGFEETYDLLLDPLNGNFVHLRRIEKPATR